MFLWAVISRWRVSILLVTFLCSTLAAIAQISSVREYALTNGIPDLIRSDTSSNPANEQPEATQQPSVLTLIRSEQMSTANPAIKDLIGIPFMNPSSSESREDIEKRVKEYVVKRLPELQGWPEDYSALPEHKAVAVHFSAAEANFFEPLLYAQDDVFSYIGYWGGAWRKDSLDAARAAALSQCGGACDLVFEDDQILIPSRVIDDILSTRDKFIRAQRQKLENAEKLILLERAQQLTAIKVEPPSDRFSPPINRALKVGYPDRDQDYTSSCQDRVFFALLPVTKDQELASISILSQIGNLPMYGFYQRTFNTIRLDLVGEFTDRSKGHLMERMARFARNYHFTSDPLAGHLIVLPKNLQDALHDQVITDIWLEGSVRVTRDSRPLEIDEYLSPLAVKTIKGFYLGIQIRMPDPGYYCTATKPFVGKVLDLTGSARGLTFATKALQTILTNIKDVFALQPISAVPIVGETFAPGEFGMSKEREPSNLLGPPYYEDSTYTVETWASNDDNPVVSLYARQTFKGVNPERVNFGDHIYLFLKLSHIHTRAVHKNDLYSEPDQTEMDKIDVQVNAATVKALKSACAALHGAFDGTICKVTKAQ